MNNQAELLEKPKDAGSAANAESAVPEAQRLMEKISNLLAEQDELLAEIRQREQQLKVGRADLELAFGAPDVVAAQEQIEKMQAGLVSAEDRRAVIEAAIETARARLGAIAEQESLDRRRGALIAARDLARNRASLSVELSGVLARAESLVRQLRAIDQSMGYQSKIAGLVAPASLIDGRRLNRALVGELYEVAPNLARALEVPRVHRLNGFDQYVRSASAEGFENLLAEHVAENAADQQAVKAA